MLSICFDHTIMVKLKRVLHTPPKSINQFTHACIKYHLLNENIGKFPFDQCPKSFYLYELKVSYKMAIKIQFHGVRKKRSKNLIKKFVLENCHYGLAED